MPLGISGQIDRVSGVIDRAGNLRPAATADEQEKTNDRLGNHDDLTQTVYTTSGTEAEALDAMAVPEGVDVLIEYQQGNDGVVFVGDESTQASALTSVGQYLSFGVTDTSAIHVRTPTAGDGVVVTFESNGGDA